MSRIRTIINLDEDSQMISKEALVLITKATELFEAFYSEHDPNMVAKVSRLCYRDWIDTKIRRQVGNLIETYELEQLLQVQHQ